MIWVKLLGYILRVAITRFIGVCKTEMREKVTHKGVTNWVLANFTVAFQSKIKVKTTGF